MHIIWSECILILSYDLNKNITENKKKTTADEHHNMLVKKAHNIIITFWYLMNHRNYFSLIDFLNI